MTEVVTMTNRELDKLRVIRQVLTQQLRWREAATQLGLTARQIGRLCRRVRTEGNRGVIHRLRGRPSNRRLPPALRTRALQLIQRHYPDFGPTFATEQLAQRHHLTLSPSSVRRAMLHAGWWTCRMRRTPHRAWRPRRACLGELVQLDGSDHAWFEGRGSRCVLLLYLDDATSRLLHGAFVAVEDTRTLFQATRHYLRRWGRPLAFYVDKDSIYRVNRQATIEEQLQDTAPLTQFTRAMTELGIAVIPAHSPQAKGRIERGFQTHQDRLVKELRLAGISDRETATRFLQRRYMPAHNRRFAVAPANPTDAHRPLLPTHDLAAILSVQTLRTLDHDFTVRLDNRFFQVRPHQPVRPKDLVLIEHRLDGTLRLRCRGRYLAYTPIAKAPAAPPRLLMRLGRRSAWRKAHVPPRTHPWKDPMYVARRRRAGVQT